MEDILISRVVVGTDPTLGILNPVTLCLIIDGLSIAGLMGVTVCGTVGTELLLGSSISLFL